MKWISLFLVTVFSPIVSATGPRYILTPKKSQVSSYEDYGLEVLASFGNEWHANSLNDKSVVFYTTSHENLMKHKATLSELYDIEEDVEVKIDYTNSDSTEDEESESVPWHLGRITKRKLPLSESYPYKKSGNCHKNEDLLIDTYIVDTGIDVHHPQFGGRAVWSGNFAGDHKDTDCNSHGTHVAGLVGSMDYGVCTDANLYAVKVLDCQGSGALSGVIRGIEWAFKKHLEKSKSEKRTVKSIINMSLGGGFSRALNMAAEACVKNDNHFYIVVAAGNENDDACDGSPSGAESMLTVMASDKNDNKAWFSNWGKCGNVYSPGVDVLSTVPNGKTAVYSGTSMASPVMAGVLNHYVDMYPQHNQAQMLKIVKKLATKNTIKGNKAGTINRFVYLERN